MLSRTVFAVSLCLLFLAAPAAGSWLPGGNLIAAGDLLEPNLRVLADGEGGAIVLWSEVSGSSVNLKAQRFSASGREQWTPGGVEIRPYLSYVRSPALCSDGAGGAWVVWGELRGVHPGPFIQHVDASGALDASEPAGWPLLDVATRTIENMKCVPDGTGGAVVSWNEYWLENDGIFVTPHHVDVRAQRVHSAGVIAWGGAGRTLYPSEHSGGAVPLVPVSDGGCIVGWQAFTDTRLQRLDGIGDTVWDPSGVPVQGPAFALHGAGSDAADGAMALYRGASEVLFVERLFPGGGLAWTAPLPLWTAGSGPSTVYNVDMISHPGGRLFCAWVSDESGSKRVHGALVGPDRSLTWGTGALVISNELAPVREPRVLLAGDDHIVIWRETGVPGDAILGQSVSLAAQRQWGQEDVLLLARGESVRELEGVASTLGPAIFAWIEGPQAYDQWLYVSAVTGSGSLPGTNLTVDMAVDDLQPDLGENLQPRIVVRNEGDTSLEDVEVAWYADLDHPPTAADVPTGSPLMIASLDAGDSVVWEPTTIGAAVEEVWLSWALVDPDDAIEEPGAESDNIAGPVVVEWTARPDLRISSLHPGDTTPRVGDALAVDVVVVNEGSADCGPFDIDLYRDRATAPPSGVAGTHTHRVAYLAHGETYTWVVEGLGATALDAWSMWARVDTQNEREESDEGNNVAGPRSVLWQPPSLAGWPVAVGAACTAPAVAHLDRTLTLTRNVVVACVDGTVHAFSDRGESLPGWPLAITGPISASVAVGDVTGDDALEVVIGNQAGQLFCVGADATPEWIFAVPGGSAIMGSVALSDLTGDGDLEVIVGTEGGSLFALSGAGVPLSGWPLKLGAPLYAPPTVGQLDGSGLPEILAVTAAPGSGYSDVHLLTASGASYGAAWPTRIAGEVRGAPAAGDIGGDADLEIVLGTDTGQLFLFTLAGPVPGYPVAYGAGFGRAFALADLAGDAHVEILAPAERWVSTFPPHWETHFVAFDATGTTLPGWPLVSHGTTSVRPANGPVVWSWPKTLERSVGLGLSTGTCVVVDAGALPHDHLDLSAASGISASLAVEDLDLDQQLDVVVASETQVDVYSLLQGSYRPDLLTWPTFRHDNCRTGVFGTGTPTAAPPDVPEQRSVALGLPRPNPFNPGVELAYSIAAPGRVEIAVFDVAGRRVRTLLDEVVASGGAVHWDGRDTQGRRTASGTYFVRMRTHADEVRTRKVTLLQ